VRAVTVADAQFARLALLTKLDRGKWERILAAPAAVQRLELANYADQDWARPGSGPWAEVLAVLGVIGTIAGVVGGVAGAASAVAALRAL
jgi:hypothetical protein